MNEILFEEIKEDLELYEMGRALRVVYKTPAWNLVMGVFEDYRDRANDELTDLPPGDPRVVAAHAAVSALKDTVRKAQQDFEAAIEMANNPPQEITDYLNGVLEVLDVAKAQGME